MSVTWDDLLSDYANKVSRSAGTLFCEGPRNDASAYDHEIWKSVMPGIFTHSHGNE
jgi:hypothetical protein